MISPFGVKIGGGSSSPATVQNSDLSYTTTVNSGDTLNLPDITVTDSDGSTFTSPAVKNVTCTPAATPVGATLMKTGQTTSYRTGDDGDIEAGRATDFFTLASNNPFGNTNRFTDELGGQTYTNSIVIDWSTYNGSTVLGIDRRINGGNTNINKSWNEAVDESKIFINSGFSNWRLPNINELCLINNYSKIVLWNYAPFTTLNAGYSYWSSTSSSSTNAIAIFPQGFSITSVNKTLSSNYRYIPVRTFTVTGTTLT